MRNFEMGRGPEIPQIKNEVITTLEGEELDKVRYEELSKDLRNNPNTNKTEIKFQWKGTAEEGFDEKEDFMTAKMELLEDSTLELKAGDWQASISPDGKISGNMPPKLVDFLTYNKIERDVEINGKTTHEIDYIKNGFGADGHAIIESPIYDEK